jgi:predicted PurR-regulated permease PerM
MSGTIFPTRHHKTILLVLIIGLGIFLVYEIRGLISAILGAVVLYSLFKASYLNLSQHYRLNKRLSAIIIIFISLVIIVLPFIFISLTIVNKIDEFESHPLAINQFIQNINELGERWFHDPQLMQHKLQFIQGWSLQIFSKVLTGIFKTIFNVIIMFLILFFMLIENEKFENTVEYYVPFREKSTQLLRDELRNITRSNVLGQGLTGLAQMICVSSSFLVFHLPEPLFWGLIAGCLSFIPVFGVPSIFIGAACFSFLNGNTTAGTGMLIWGFIVVAGIENYLRMAIGKQFANVHPLLTIIGILIGIPAFGIAGIVFGPLLFSYFVLLISIYERKYIKNVKEENS